MSKTIVNSVLGALFIDGKIILVKRQDIPIWTIPGGGVELNETCEEAILREIKEETGYDATIEKKIALYTSNSIFIKPVYLFTLSAKNTIKESAQIKEVREIGAFSKDELPYPIAPFQADWIKDAFSNNSYFEKHITSITFFYLLKLFLKSPIIGIRFLLMKASLPINSRVSHVLRDN